MISGKMSDSIHTMCVTNVAAALMYMFTSGQLLSWHVVCYELVLILAEYSSNVITQM